MAAPSGTAGPGAAAVLVPLVILAGGAGAFATGYLASGRADVRLGGAVGVDELPAGVPGLDDQEQGGHRAGGRGGAAAEPREPRASPRAAGEERENDREVHDGGVQRLWQHRVRLRWGYRDRRFVPGVDGRYPVDASLRSCRGPQVESPADDGG